MTDKACLWMCGDCRITLLQLLQLAQQAGFLAEDSEVYLQANAGGAASIHPHDREHVITYCRQPGVTTLLLAIHSDCQGVPQTDLRVANMLANAQWAREMLPSIRVRGFIVDTLNQQFEEVEV